MRKKRENTKWQPFCRSILLFEEFESWIHGRIRKSSSVEQVFFEELLDLALLRRHSRKLFKEEDSYFHSTYWNCSSTSELSNRHLYYF